MRADAQKNVAAVLDAAKVVFHESGVDAPLQKVADRAGVGVGTLYRHFARRSDLIVAVMQHELDACIGVVIDLGRARPPWDALVAGVESFTAFVGTKRGFAAALHSGDPAYDGLPQLLLDRLDTPFEELRVRAVEAGEIRDDLSTRDLLTAVALLCNPVPGEPDAFNTRVVGVFLDGLRCVSR
jgi:AcrR family transcriptional regulator